MDKIKILKWVIIILLYVIFMLFMIGTVFDISPAEWASIPVYQ